ncbi:MAG: protein kinase domain-containing protein [Pyrinomonadaceae bacterium]
MKALAPNTLLQNRYLIVQLIGKGGMGEVYLAFDQRLGSAVALKRTFFSDDEMLGNAFEREARTLARLRHPALPKVSDHFTENDTQYLAMEHISGDDLSKRLEITNKPFPLSWVLFWTDQLLDALAYLHAQEPPIVHRDIKPQNLKLTDENHIVLLDFGLAKNSIGNTRLTSTSGSIVGYTPHYAPMEQIRGTGTNPRSDLYSLSATVYQLLTNTVPPDALTRADSILNGLPDPTKSPQIVNPEIPKTISDVVLKGMSLSMEQRYANAREMQKALREAYAQMQNAMSAQTVAFNKSDVENQSSPQSPPTENLPPANNQSPANTFQPKTKDVPSSTQPNASSAPATREFAARDDFEATIKDAPPVGFKTEILPFEKIPRAEDYAPSSARESTFNISAPPTPEKESAPENFFAPEDDFSSRKEQQFDPNPTFSFINFDRENAESPTNANFNAAQKSEETYAPSETYAPAQSFAAVQTNEPRAENFAPPVKSAPPKKSGGAKTLAVAGIIGVLAIFIIGAAAIGWYVLHPSATATITPTPTPIVESTPTPIVSPTVEPAAEPTIEAITNSNGSSDAVTSDSSNTNATDRKTDVTNDARPPVEKPVQPTQVRAAPTPRVAVSTTPRAAPTAKPPIVQKTPVKTNRTDILQ